MGKGTASSQPWDWQARRVAGERRRAAADASSSFVGGGAGAGIGNPGQAPTSGRPVTPHAGSMTCSTSSATRRSCWWHGTGSEATRAHAPPGSTGAPPATSSGGMAWTGSSPTFAPSKGTTVRAVAGAGAAGPQARRQTAPAPGSRPSATGWSRPQASWCWSRSWRRTFGRAATALRPGRRAQPRHRGGPLPGRPLLPVGAGGGHHRLLRRAVARRRHGPAATADRRSARPGTGQGIPQGRHPHRGRRPAGDQHRHAAGWDPLTAA
jgi:hypothetical protein